MSARRDFRVIKLCQKLCLDIVQMQGTADKSYRYTICQDVRRMSEKVIHLIRLANDMPAGYEERIECQEKADELLEEIKDLIWVVGKCLNTGVKKEAQVELSIENLQIPLHNWMERDQKISVSSYEKQVRRQSWVLYRAKKVCEAVQEYNDCHPTERTTIALDESKARYRIAQDDYRKLVDAYDRAVKRLRTTQDKFHKDDSVLSEVLAEIEKNTGVKFPEIPDSPGQNGKNEKGRISETAIPDNIVAMKKSFVSEVNKALLEKKKEVYSDTTVAKLTE